MIATAMKTLNKNVKSVLYFLNSYGCRIPDTDKINFILETNSNAIQFLINNRTTIPISRFFEYNNIIEFIFINRYRPRHSIPYSWHHGREQGPMITAVESEREVQGGGIRSASQDNRTKQPGHKPTMTFSCLPHCNLIQFKRAP